MIRKLLFFIPALAFVCLLSGCDVAKQLQGAYNLTNCEYKYHSISNLRLSGMNLSGGVSVLDAVKLLAILSNPSPSLPLDFTLTLDVRNPNPSRAAFSALSYIIEIDGIEFTNGHLEQDFNVDAGDTKPLAIQIGTDLTKLISAHSADAILNIVKNFIGIGNEKTNVTFRLKPSFKAGNSAIASPVYLPVSFSFGGKKEGT
jgi:LEA14-like dessication related protein